MADTPIDERKFTDREVSEILRRAARDASSNAPVKREGLSLTELKAIGAEVGIDPNRLASAAQAVALESGSRSSGLLGGPSVLNFERKVRGEVSPANMPEILSVIRRTMGQPKTCSKSAASGE